MELLWRSPGLTASQIARDVDANRATISAVLSQLVEARWLTKDAVGGYHPTAHLDRQNFALGPSRLVEAAEPLLRALTEHTGYGGAFVAVTEDESEFLVLTGRAGEQVPPGVAVGNRIPVAPPRGASYMAFQPDADQERWLQLLSESERPRIREFLDTIRAEQAAVWQLDRDHRQVFDLLAEVSAALGREHEQLRTRALGQLFTLGRRGWTSADLASRTAVSVSRIQVPLLDADGHHAGFELVLGVLRTDLPVTEVHHHIAELRAMAAELAPLAG